MVQYRQTRTVGVINDRWMRISTMSALIGGGLMALLGIALLSTLRDAAPAIVDPLGAIAMILLALGLPALYFSERHWFGPLAKVGFGLMAGGWIVAAVAMPVAIYGPEVMFFGYLLGLLIAMTGAFVFGVSMLRSDDLAIPRLGAWLLVAALPVGLPFTIAFISYVMDGATPWGGPSLLYGLAWIVFANYLRTHRADVSQAEVTPQ